MIITAPKHHTPATLPSGRSLVLPALIVVAGLVWLRVAYVSFQLFA